MTMKPVWIVSIRHETVHGPEQVEGVRRAADWVFADRPMIIACRKVVRDDDASAKVFATRDEAVAQAEVWLRELIEGSERRLVDLREQLAALRAKEAP